jgi:S-adenosylmethionine:tRNA ribosyltransferase-isomerase
MTVAARRECAESYSPLAQFDFELPAELIAQEPAARRDRARLMVLERNNSTRSHACVKDLPKYLQPGDLLVVNDTRVIRARLHGRLPTGGRVELLAVRPATASAGARPSWICLAKPAKRLSPGLRIRLDGGAEATVTCVLGNGRCEIEPQTGISFLDYLEQHGEMPLPPYIRRPDGSRTEDGVRYQTVFAKPLGAVAAPTAGLHFTDELIAELARRQIAVVSLTLHVGPGTFMPIRHDDMKNHVMEPEWYDIPAETVDAIRKAKDDRRAVVAVGTTTTRALESAAASAEGLRAGKGWASLFITPGHGFRVIDALFTNFHLPKSTLLLLVSAFAGRDAIREAYEEAVAQRYRFYSYGDAMLIR